MDTGLDPGLDSQKSTGCFDIVALAASAGGLHAIGTVLAGLPENFPGTIVAVQHLDPTHPSMMAKLLDRRCSILVKEAQDGEALQPGTAYLAPPNKHLLVNPDRTISLSSSEMVHFLRPSADLLFESVAASCRESAIAVVLSGTGSDGTMGICAIKKMGGTVIVQDADSSQFFGMPNSAIQTGDVDFILPLEEISDALVNLIHRGVK